jgi:thiamine biosynthesis lipoprotein
MSTRKYSGTRLLFAIGFESTGEREMSTQLFRIEESADAMGSTFSIVLYGDDQSCVEEAVKAAFGEVERVESILSIYRPDSEWNRVNRCAAQEAVRVSPEAFSLLARCLDYSRLSEGAFDVSVGPLLRAWGLVRGTGRVPGEAELGDALAVVGYRHVSLDPETGTVRFDSPGVEIDPGGIGKGYAVDRAVGILKEMGFKKALVAGAASSIYGLGAPPGEPRGWRVDIPDPTNPRRSAAQVFLKDLSLSTSGNYEKSFWAGDRVYSHIMDPRTGYPAQGVALVSVVAPRATDSEAWTKPCFILGREWAAKHIPPGFRAFICEDRTGGCRWL